MACRQNVVCLVLALCACAVLVADAQVPVPVNPPTTTAARAVSTSIVPNSSRHPVERHHSVQPPLGSSQVYWNFGGSTVVTNNKIRLTPSSQDKRGWLWNEYPLESENFEVEFKMEVFSKPHFGGDGMGFWVLAGDHDPAFSTDPEALCGPVVGMKTDFNGFGVVFDTYDNDNRRDNPSILVLKSAAAGSPPTKWNHDQDFATDIVTKVVSDVEGVTGTSRTYSAYRCLAEFRNTGKTSKVLVKMLRKQLHVYVDTQDGVGWKFCLAVEMEQTYKDYHIAFTAATGQVADNHDIYEVSTRYLKDTDENFDDAHMARLDGSRSRGSWTSFAFGIVALVGLCLTALGGYEMSLLWSVRQHDALRIVRTLNTSLVAHWTAHALCVLLCVVTLSWLGMLFNAPLVVYRIVALASGSAQLDAMRVSQQSHHVRIWLQLITYIITELYYLHCFTYS